MSEDTKSSDYRYPRFGDQQDWRKWTQKAKPKLYAIQSKAEPEKTVYQMLQGPNPHETGRRKYYKHEVVYEPRLHPAMGDACDGTPIKDARGNPVTDRVEKTSGGSEHRRGGGGNREVSLMVHIPEELAGGVIGKGGQVFYLC